jgi:hypothetical protein
VQRVSLPPPERIPFFVQVDEFQTFSSDAFAPLLSEARKFTAHFALANQYTDQLPHAVRSAVIGGAGYLIVFGAGSRDAELLAHEFGPMGASTIADWWPYSAWLLRGISRDRTLAEPKLYEPLDASEPIREQNKRQFK